MFGNLVTSCFWQLSWPPRLQSFSHFTIRHPDSGNYNADIYNLDADILYGAIDTGLVPGTNSMLNWTPPFGNKLQMSLGNTLGNSHIACMSLATTSHSTLKEANITSTWSSSLNDILTWLVYMKIEFVLSSGSRNNIASIPPALLQLVARWTNAPHLKRLGEIEVSPPLVSVLLMLASS